MTDEQRSEGLQFFFLIRFNRERERERLGYEYWAGRVNL